jgi:hypothetical protein
LASRTWEIGRFHTGNADSPGDLLNRSKQAMGYRTSEGESSEKELTIPA